MWSLARCKGGAKASFGLWDFVIHGTCVRPNARLRRFDGVGLVASAEDLAGLERLGEDGAP